MSDDELEGIADSPPAAFDPETWVHESPPIAQRRFYFHEDRLLFDSLFDSGNLMDVERTGVYQYNLHLAPDCAGSPRQTNNKQWFHFAIYGGLKGQTVLLTIVNIPLCRMYSYPGYAPTAAVVPNRPNYARLNCKVSVRRLEPTSVPQPSTPISATSTSTDFSLYVSPITPKPVGLRGPSEPTAALTQKLGTSAAPPPKSTVMCNLDFDYSFEFDSYLKDLPDLSSRSNSDFSSTNPAAYTSGAFLANAHPYPYAKLQRQLSAWEAALQPQTATPAPCTRLDSDTTFRRFEAAGSGSNQSSNGIYFHRELLTYSLEKNRCDLLTISGCNGLSSLPPPGSSPADLEGYYEPLIDVDLPVVPTVLASGRIEAEVGASLMKRCSPFTGRPRVFPKKRYVVLSARVHPGEIPSSHILHGAIDFLLNPTDPRAAALRRHFVFVIVPMLNPDGVVRGHSRADTTGQNLNRTYAKPCRRRHPTTYALRQLLLQLQATGRLALYVDIHAHANKKGMFFYGNAMKAEPQIQNLLYAKLVSLNTPYFEFQSSNFSEQNMFAVGKNGEGKDTSSRVVLFKETGFVHSYTLEANYLCGTTLNEVRGLGVEFPGEEYGTSEGAPSPKYTVAIFADVGRALVVSLADLHGVNPVSRLPMTSFHNNRGVALWIQRAIIVDAWEQVRRQQILQSGLSLARERERSLASSPSFSSMAATQFPPVVTTRASKTFPPTTVLDLSGAVQALPGAALNDKFELSGSGLGKRAAAAEPGTQRRSGGTPAGAPRKASLPQRSAASRHKTASGRLSLK